MTELVLGLLRKEADEIRDLWRDGLNWTDHAKHGVAIREDIVNLTYEDLMEGLSEDDDEERVGDSPG